MFVSPADVSLLFSCVCLLQVDNAKVLHYVGAGVAFPTSMLFVCLQSALTYRLAKTQGEYSVGHLRLVMSLVALISLVLSILLRPRARAKGLRSQPANVTQQCQSHSRI